MRTLIFCTALDPHLGKVDKSSLSEQTLMEVLISGFTNKQRICNNADDPSDISEWAAEIHINFGRVILIEWTRMQLEGSIDLRWLPPSLENFYVEENSLSGSLDLTDLPETLIGLSALSNEFSGTVSLDCLPKVMMTLDVSENQLCGSVNLANLPESLKYLFLPKNLFSGTIDLTRLPPKISEIYLCDNRFVGDTDFSQLPESLNYLDIGNTQLSGTIRGVVTTITTKGTKVINATYETGIRDSF